MGDSCCAVRASEVNLGHSQEGWQAWKNRLASTRNDAEKYSSSRLIVANDRLNSNVGTRIGSERQYTFLVFDAQSRLEFSKSTSFRSLPGTCGPSSGVLKIHGPHGVISYPGPLLAVDSTETSALRMHGRE